MQNSRPTSTNFIGFNLVIFQLLVQFTFQLVRNSRWIVENNYLAVTRTYLLTPNGKLITVEYGKKVGFQGRAGARNSH